MSNDVNPHTTGDDPVLGSAPTITINEKTYQLRRLGIKDTFAIARIVSIGAATLSRSGQQADMNDPAQIGTLLLAGMMSAEKIVLELLAGIVGVTPAELQDPDVFPMGSEIDIIEALVEHQDVKAFFVRASVLMRKLPEMQTRSQEAST